MKIAKLAVVLLALLGLVGLGMLLSRTERVRPTAQAARPSAAPEEQATAEPAELVAPDAPVEEGESRTPVARASTSIPVPRPAARTTTETIHLSGTIVAIDELGIEHPAEDGSFFLTLASARASRVALADARSARLKDERIRDIMERLGDTGPAFVTGQGDLLVRVRAGSWSADPPREPILDEVRAGTWRLGIESCELGRRAAVQLHDHDEPALAPEKPQALRVRWLPDLVLDVRERSSGRPLDHVILYELHDQPDLDGMTLHPGLSAEKEARDAGPSPVRIVPRSASWQEPRQFFAKGPGFAWGYIQIPPGQEEEHVLLLDPGGDLELVVTGAARDRSTELRLIRSEGGRGLIGDAREAAKTLALEVPLGDKTSLHIDGLRVGRYSARAEIHPEAPILVGSCELEVRADTTVTAVLALEPPPTARVVPFEGELVLPAEWQLASFRLLFARRGMGPTRELDSSELMREPGTRDRYRWALPPVAPGRYDVRIDCGYRSTLDTGPAGRRDALIEVPPPCSISVRCLDTTGADAHPETLKWYADDEHVTSPVPWNPEHDRWEFRAPAGELSIINTGRSYWDSSTRITASPGTNEVVLRLRRAR